MFFYRAGRGTQRALKGKRIRVFPVIVLFALIVAVLAGAHACSNPHEVPPPGPCTLCHSVMSP